MRKLSSSSAAGGVVLGLAITLLAPALAITAPNTPASKPQSRPKVAMLTATGEGAMPTVEEQPNRAKAYLQAKGYAQAQAVANLIQEVRGTSINYSATGKNYALEEKLNQEIQGMIEHVRVKSERRVQIGKDTVVQVVVEAPMPEQINTARTPASKSAKTSAGPSWVVASAAPVAPPSKTFRKAKEAAYTSVIVDSLGLGVVRAMSPKILRRDGSEVWGTVKVDYDFLADHGIVAYARTLGEAYSNSRAGDNPLVLRAQKRGSSPYKCDVVLSNSDADYLLAENDRAGFLKDFRVIFLVDASR